MGIDVLSYSTATQAMKTAEQSLSNARQWQKDTSYMIGDTCIFNNSFYVCAYSHDSGSRFQYDAWTKINNSADKLKEVNINLSDKVDGKVMTYDKDTNTIALKSIPNYINDNSKDSLIESYSINKINDLLDKKLNMTALGIANGIAPLDENMKIPLRYLTNTSSGNSTHVVQTNEDKEKITDIKSGDRVIVLQDKDNNRVGYIYDGLNWFKDSDTNWENVNIDWNSIINKPKIPTKTSELIKNDVYTQKQIDELIGNSILETEDKTLKGAINEIYQKAFQYGVNVKENVVTALTSKNQDVTTQSSWEEIFKAIYDIEGSNKNSDIKQITKLNIVASQSNPYIYDVKLDNKIKNNNIIYGLREFSRGQDKTTLITSFENADKNYFQTNENVNFDGDLYIKEKASELSLVLDNESNTGNEHVADINLNDYDIITSIEDNSDENNPKIIVKNKVYNTMVCNNTDMDLSNLDSWNKIIFNSTATNGGKILLAISIDEGETYKSYNIITKQWEYIDIYKIEDFKNKGMSKTITDSLCENELELLRKESDKVRFAYYLEIENDKSIAKCEDISIAVAMMGAYIRANKNDYNISIGIDNKNIRITFYKDGTYTFNYVD